MVSPQKRSKSARHEVRRTRSNGQATMQRLLKFGRAELHRSGAIGFNVDRVVRQSKVSASSLYHHFGSRDGFLAALEFERSFEEIMREMEMLNKYITESDDPEALFKVTELVFSHSGNPTSQERRRHRIETLAAASHNPGLRQMLANAQQKGTARHIEVLQLAVMKSGAKLEQPIEGIAYLIQSLLIGRTLVDLMDDSDLSTAWEQTALAALRGVLAPIV